MPGVSLVRIIQAGSDDDFLLELIYPNGTRLRIKNVHDLEHIRNLVSLFG